MPKNSILNGLAKSLKRGETLLPLIRTFLAKEHDEISKGKLSHADVVKKDANMTIACFKERYREYNHDEKIDGERFHPSRLGACMRQLVMGHFCEEKVEKTGDDLLRETMIFETGTYLGVFFQNLCERAGCLEDREVAINNAKERILGHADGIVCIDGKRSVLELKSINERGFTMVTEPKTDHVRQVHAYMKGLGLTHTIFVYMNKNTGQLKEFQLNFDQTTYDYHVRKRIDYFFFRIKKRELPPREGHSAQAFPCTFCSFQRECWETETSKQWMRKNKMTHAKFGPPQPPATKTNSAL